jgi:RHS repeat-associated protein
MTDGQGTTKLVTSSNQTITSTQETEAFGRFIGGTGSTASPFGYHGSEGYRSDGDGPAGLEPYQKVGARYYDATFGRFITRDTDLSQAAYAYCDGDPVNNTDPSGHHKRVGINWKQVGKDVVVGLTTATGAAIGTSVGGPIGGIIGAGVGAGVGAIINQFW